MQQTKQGRQIKTVKCPYMPQHIMPAESLLNHLSRCSATNKHLFTKCKYNPIHVYPNQIINEHYRKCKDKAKFAKQQESSDDWGVSDDEKQKNAQVQAKKEQNKNNNSALRINQSAISLKTDPQSEQEWVKIESSDEDDYEQTKKQIQSMSISSSETSKKSKAQQKSMQSFTESEPVSWKSKNNASFDKKQEKQNQLISRRVKKEFLNESDKFEYEESEPQTKQKLSKKANKTMELITESEKSKDHGTKKTDQTMEPSKTVDDDSDIEVEDLC